MSWDLFVMDLPQDLTSADALPPNWVPRALPPREEIVRVILDIDPTADASDPAWVRVSGPDFSVEINFSGKVPLTDFACHVRGADPAVGFIATLLERLRLRALDPSSDSGLFDPATAATSQKRWREYRNQLMAEQQRVSQETTPGSGAPFTVVARIAEPIQPAARGAKYEDPLSAVLVQQGCGQVTGGGSQLNERFEIATVDVDMKLANLEDALALARTTLVTLGAPRGSALHFLRNGKPRTLPIHGDGPETDSPEPPVGLTRSILATPGPGPTIEDPAAIKAKAAKFLAAFERLFLVHPETVPADLSVCEPATLAWYDRVTGELAAAGFRMLGNFTTAEIAARKDALASAFSRKFLSTDGRIRATVVGIAPGKPGQALKPVIGLNSDLDDGTCLRTAAMAAEKWDQPAQVFVEYLPPETPINDIAARHRARLQSYLRPDGTDRVSTMQSIEDVFASEARTQLQTSIFRRRRGIPSIDEIQRFGVAQLIAALMHREMGILKSRASDEKR